MVRPNKEPNVTDTILNERGKALENEFFHKQNEAKLAAMKQKLDAEQSKDALRKASGMTDDAVLDRLVALGLAGNNVAALSLVPLVQVAWADGKIQDDERTAILAGAQGKGLDVGTPGYEVLEAWLTRPPSDDLFVAWEAYIKALAGQLTPDQAKLLRNQIVGFAKLIAGAAGGILGFAKVSASEEKVLHRIDAAFGA